MKKTLLMLALLASGYAAADTTISTALTNSAAQAQSGAASQANPSNNQNINFNNPATVNTNNRQSGTATLNTVATVYAPPIGVTAPCFVGYSGGVTVVGFGASLGGGVEDVGCTLRETSRLLYGIGQTDAAAKVMCANADAARAMGPAICPVAIQTLPAPVEPARRPLAQNCETDSFIAARTKRPLCQ